MSQGLFQDFMRMGIYYIIYYIILKDTINPLQLLP